MMKSDVLDTFETIRVCTAYKKGDDVLCHMPYDTAGWEAVYEDVPGWKTSLSAVRSEKDFPKAFADYIAYLEKALDAPIRIVSVGPDREETVMRE